MKRAALSVAFGLLAFCIGFAMAGVLVDTYAQTDTTVQECQYPDRYYEDGSCDNSDPACPETLKDPLLRGDCPEPIHQKAPEPKLEPIEPIKEVCQ